MTFFVGTSLVTLLAMYIAQYCYRYENGNIIVSKRIYNENKRYSVLDVLFVAFPLFVYSAFRYGCGPDYYGYEQVFNNIALGSSSRYPVLVNIIYDIIIQMGGKFSWVVFITSFLLLFLVVREVVKESPNCILSLYLFLTLDYYFETMSAFRQGIAIGICMYSIRYIRERKLIKFLICVLVAAGFHSSAIVFAVVYVVNFIELDVKFQWLILGVILVIKDKLFSVVTYVVGLVGYSHYYESKYFLINEDYLALRLCNLVVFGIMTYVYYHVKKRENECSISDLRKMKIYLFMQFLATCVIFIGGYIPECHRVMYYFQWPSLISIPFFISRTRSKKNRTFLYLLVVALFGLFYIWINMQAGYMDIMYKMIFFK